jgi:hypothetical protein
MATPSLPPKFAQLDRSRLYALRIGPRELFRFVIPVTQDRIILVNGDHEGSHMVADDITPFLNDRFEIVDIGTAPFMASIRTAAYIEESAAERANAFIRSQHEKATRVNATNNSKTLNRKKGINYNNNSKQETYNELIKYFGFENVPEKQLVQAIRNVSLFFRSAHNSKNLSSNQFNLKRKEILPKISQKISFNTNAKAYTHFELFEQSVRLLSNLKDMIHEKIKAPSVVSEKKSGNGNLIENLDSWLLENNPRPDRGGGAGGMGGGRRKRHTKRRSMKRRHRTRRH